MNKRRLGILLGGAIIAIAACYMVYHTWLAPTRILIVNPLPAQGADIALNNDCSHIEVTCIKMEEVKDLSGYDVIMMYGRGLFLDEIQIAEMQRVADKGVPIFTNALQHFNFIVNYNITPEEQNTLQTYFQNACKKNYRNALRYLRHLATPQRWGDQSFETPVKLPNNLYYHQEYGQYFKTHKELTAYLKEKRLYHEGARNIAFISGISFPMEGNRAHVDTLISRLTQAGFNVYPITGSGKGRDKMIPPQWHIICRSLLPLRLLDWLLPLLVLSHYK